MNEKILLKRIKAMTPDEAALMFSRALDLSNIEYKKGEGQIVFAEIGFSDDITMNISFNTENLHSNSTEQYQSTGKSDQCIPLENRDIDFKCAFSEGQLVAA